MILWDIFTFKNPRWRIQNGVLLWILSAFNQIWYQGVFKVTDFKFHINFQKFKMADSKWRPFVNIVRFEPNLVCGGFQAHWFKISHQFLKTQNGGFKMEAFHKYFRIQILIYWGSAKYPTKCIALCKISYTALAACKGLAGHPPPGGGARVPKALV